LDFKYLGKSPSKYNNNITNHLQTNWAFCIVLIRCGTILWCQNDL